MVFGISLFLVIALAVVAGLAPKPFEAVSDAALAAVIQHAGWLYLLIVFLTLAFLVYLAFGPLGAAAHRRARCRTGVFERRLAVDAVRRRHGHRPGVLGRGRADFARGHAAGGA